MFKAFRASAQKWAPFLFAVLLGCASTPVAAGGATSPATAAAAPASSPALPFDPSVTTGTLSNGLRYYLKRQKPEDQRAQLLLVVKAGSLHEEEDQRGVAHFVEHMAFQGTRRFSKEELKAVFERSGVAFGSDMNASTGYDHTQYQLNVPTDDPKLLTTALDVLEDWATSVTFGEQAVQQERGVILAEWLARQGLRQRMAQQQQDLLLAGSRYLQREPIGQKLVLEQLSRQRLLDYYQRWYRPERMAIVAVGDIEPAGIEAMVRQRFAQLPAGEPQSEPNLTIPVPDEPVAAVITDPELTASAVGLLLRSPGRVPRTEAELRAQLLLGLGTTMLNRRLSEITQRPDAPFAGAGGGVSYLFDAQQIFQAGARAKQGRLPESLAVMLAELERVERHGFGSSELDRERSAFLRGYDRRVAAKDTVSIGAIAFALSGAFVTGVPLMAPEYERDFGKRVLEGLSAADVSQAMRERLVNGQRLVIASGAERDAMPEKPSLLAALSSADALVVEPYQDRSFVGSLLPQLPEPARIVAEKRMEEVGVTEWTLSNGARVVLKPTEFAADEIVGQSTSFGGHARVAKRDVASALYAADIVQAGGVGQLDRLTLSKALAGKVANVSPWINELSEGIGSRAAPKDIETMFQLMHLYITAPRRDEQAFLSWRERFREQIRNRDLSPGAIFGDAISLKLWGNEPRRRAATPALLDEINLDTALKLYRERFADVSDFTFVFVGKIDEAAFRPLVERYLASLPGKGRKETFKDLGLHKRKGVTEVTVFAGKEDKTFVNLTFHGESRWSDPDHTDLDSLNAYLGIRMREVLREKLGTVYTPRVSYGFERLPYDHYSLTVSFESKPADVDPLIRAAREVIAEVKKSGIPASYVEKLSSQRTRDLQEYYRSNGFWLDQLLTKYRMKEDLKLILTLHELTRRVTSENVQRAARKFLRDDQYLMARLEPAAAAPGSGSPASSGATPPSEARPAPAGTARPPAAPRGPTPTSRSALPASTSPAN